MTDERPLGNKAPLVLDPPCSPSIWEQQDEKEQVKEERLHTSDVNVWKCSRKYPTWDYCLQRPGAVVSRACELSYTCTYVCPGHVQTFISLDPSSDWEAVV